jgi:TRAP-type mannitol/chloroaromatic compound transport system permease small subunit
MKLMLDKRDRIDRVLDRMADTVGWLFILTTIVIAFDVITRKVGYQMPGMGSTKLQELEWHLHTALFSFWLGAAYIHNSHVRIDIAYINSKPRTIVFAEFLGCLFFAIPYCLLALYFSADFTWEAWVDNEASPSSNGLPFRWIPKGCLTAGLLLLLAGVISVLMRSIVYLFGDPGLRERATPAVVADKVEASS